VSERCHVVGCERDACARVFQDDDPHIGTPACMECVDELDGTVEVDPSGLGAYLARRFEERGRTVRHKQPTMASVRLCPPEAKA
jgi:hypothetical protein